MIEKNHGILRKKFCEGRLKITNTWVISSYSMIDCSRSHSESKYLFTFEMRKLRDQQRSVRLRTDHGSEMIFTMSYVAYLHMNYYFFLVGVVECRLRERETLGFFQQNQGEREEKNKIHVVVGLIHPTWQKQMVKEEKRERENRRLMP